jgi:hypothetical protein
VGDFNGDGKLDVLVANTVNNNVSVFLGNGDGTFQAPRTSAVGLKPSSVAVGDFNGDGKLDLAVVDSSPNGPLTVSILLGNGDGTFQPPQAFAVQWPQHSSVAVGDFNGDAIPILPSPTNLLLVEAAPSASS